MHPSPPLPYSMSHQQPHGPLHAGSRLVVSSHNHVHYMFDALRPHLPPLARFTGHRANSFYVRAAFSPDGDHLLSGSTDGNAYIWQVSCTYYVEE